MKVSLLVSVVVAILGGFWDKAEAEPRPRYEATWSSLESRPLPSWYDSVKVGIFIHWGVYSVPAFGGYVDYPNHYAEWFWHGMWYRTLEFAEFMDKNYPPNWTYQKFASQFHAEFFDPLRWAEIFQKSGAKYVVLTSKHHEGFSLYPSKYSFGWNSMDVGPKRDLVGDLAKAIRETTDLKFGLYHSLFEWFFANPLYNQDRENGFHTDEFVRLKTLPELYEIVEMYQPEIIWSDGADEASSDYWQSKEFLAWLYNESPVKETVVTNDRWGNETVCKHGGYMTCADHYNPGVLQPFKWENCMTLDKFAFSNRRNAKIEDYLTPHELIKVLVETVSCGGNLLVNVGPTADGMIEAIQEERLLQLGEWLAVNGEAIYDSVPWLAQSDPVTPGLWYTTNTERHKVYAINLLWPSSGQVLLDAIHPNSVGSVQILGSSHNLTWTTVTPEQGILVDFPRSDENQSKWAWTLVITETDDNF